MIIRDCLLRIRYPDPAEGAFRVPPEFPDIKGSLKPLQGVLPEDLLRGHLEHFLEDRIDPAILQLAEKENQQGASLFIEALLPSPVRRTEQILIKAMRSL